MTLNFFGCFNVSGIKTQPISETVDYETNVANKPHINGNALVGDKQAHELDLLTSADVGKGLSLGFDGTLENNVITFEPPSDTDLYDIDVNYEYEIDLHFPAVVAGGVLDDNIQMVIKNNNKTYEIIAPTHADSTTHATVNNLKQLMYYDAETGFRWLFKARHKVTSTGVNVLLCYPVVTDLKELDKKFLRTITGSKMMDVLTEETPSISTGEIFVCSDTNNGYTLGHIYSFTGSAWLDCTTGETT